MTINETRKNNNKSFQKKLYIVLSIGILCLAIITAITSSWIDNKIISEIEIESALQHVTNAAKQSRLALLYDSSENAHTPSYNILAYPGVVHVAIYKPDLSILFESGKQKSAHPLHAKDIENLSKPTLLHEDEIEWHFLTPAYLYDEINNQTTNEYLALSRGENRVIGYVYIGVDKTSLNDAHISSIKGNLTISLVIAIIIILSMKRIFTYFFNPLNNLANVMQRSTAGELILYTGQNDPSETVKISTAYNNLVNAVIERDNKLTKHNLMLESIVSMRTQELVAARDAAINSGKLKSQFMSNTTHELRTPLQSIIGYAEAGIESALESGQEEVIKDMENIFRNAQHLLTLINDILDFTRIEAGKMTVSPEEIELEDLISHIRSTIQPLLSVNCKLYIRNNTSLVRINADKAKLTQVLLNILSNAAKFTDSGTITLEFEFDDPQLIIHVTDTGIGMTAEQQGYIFEPFHQADGSITRKYGGTGLGLAISKQFCELMQGSIHVTSKPGEGTTFTVILPVSSENNSEMIV